MPLEIKDRGFHRFMREIERSYRTLRKSIKRERTLEILESYMCSDKTVEEVIRNCNRNLNRKKAYMEPVEIGPLLKEMEYLCMSPRSSKRNFCHSNNNESSVIDNVS